MSRNISVGRGLLQGSLLPPVLFNVFTSSLPRISRRKHPSFPLGSCGLNSLLCADSIVLHPTCRASPEHAEDLRTAQYQTRVCISPSKCEIIAPGGTQISYFRMYEERVKQSPSFECLGIPFNEEALTQRDCTLRALPGS